MMVPDLNFLSPNDRSILDRFIPLSKIDPETFGVPRMAGVLIGMMAFILLPSLYPRECRVIILIV